MGGFIDKVGNGRNGLTIDDDGHECDSKIRGPVVKNPRSDIDYRLSDFGSFGSLEIKFGVVDRREVGDDRKLPVNSLPCCKLHSGELALSCWCLEKRETGGGR